MFIAKRQPSSRYVLAAKRYRGGMTVRGGIFVIPLRVSGIYVKRYRGGCKLKIGYKRNKREDNSTHYRNRAITGVCDRCGVGVNNRSYQGTLAPSLDTFE